MSATKQPWLGFLSSTRYSFDTSFARCRATAAQPGISTTSLPLSTASTTAMDLDDELLGLAEGTTTKRKSKSSSKSKSSKRKRPTAHE